MVSLLLDSSNTKLAVGLAIDNKLIEVIYYDAWQKQSEYMIKEINDLLAKHHIETTSVNEIVCSKGPGSYTGLRIALTIAKIYAYVVKAKLYLVSSLEILKRGKKPSLCVVNARSNRSYAAIYSDTKTILEDKILENTEVIKLLNNHPEYTLCGETKYLGIKGYKTNIFRQMLEIKKRISPVDNILLVKPTYLKD